MVRLDRAVFFGRMMMSVPSMLLRCRDRTSLSRNPVWAANRTSPRHSSDVAVSISLRTSAGVNGARSVLSVVGKGRTDFATFAVTSASSR
jgi:hypothetical protein